MLELFKYLHPENITKGPKATIAGIVIAVTFGVAFFIGRINFLEAMASLAVSTLFVFAGPKKEEKKDNENH